MRLLIAGGGTGGHLFPAIAVGKEFAAADKRNKVLFVGTTRGLERKVVEKEGFDLEYIDVKPMVGKGAADKIKSLFTLPGALMQSLSILRRFKPDFVLGVGGYASGPVVLGAKMMLLRTGIQEQNIFPGITNKILGKIADNIFLAFKEAKTFFKKSKVFVTGNPVRKSLFDCNANDAYDFFMLDKDKFTIFVFGGSLGASSINKSFINNLAKLDAIKDNIQVIHQSGDSDYDFVKESYENSEIKSFVAPFIFNMKDAYCVADIIVCRAGATSISEIAALEKAAILVPYPFAAAGHQKKNAQALAAKGAAIMIEDKDLDEKLMDVLTDLYNNKDKLKKLRDNIGKTKKIDAAKEIVDVIVNRAAGKAGHV